MNIVTLRRLSKGDRERAFAAATARMDLAPYLAAVREMEGDVAYGIPLNGVSGRAVRVRMGRAAKTLGLKLKWARLPKTAVELIVELSE